MQYTINQLYDHLHEKVHSVYDVFKNFFGEENTDLQVNRMPNLLKRDIWYYLEASGVITDNNGNDYDIEYEIPESLMPLLEERFSTEKATIYVWWKDVTVTNENDKSIDIQDLYAKIEVQLNGRIPYENKGFLLNRATYTEEQFLSDYLHSHVCNIPKSDFHIFQSPCLGTGPIENTIGTLRNECDETIWMLFCDELGMYVTVESLAGTPWKYLENVGKKKLNEGYRGYDFTDAESYKFKMYLGKDNLKNFIEYYLRHGHLTLCFNVDKFSCGMPYVDYIIDVSNAFIDFYNKNLTSLNNVDTLYANKLLNEVIVANGKIYLPNNADVSPNIDRYQGKFVLNFKGKRILTSIIQNSKSDVHLTTVLEEGTAMYILKNILRTINFRYKNEHNKSRESETSTSSGQRVFYI